MATGFVAINDINAICGKTKFKTCLVSFRKKLAEYPLNKVIKLSELNNIKLSLHKNNVLCFCDGFNFDSVSNIDNIVDNKIINIKNETEEHEDPILENEFANLNTEDVADIKEEREFLYQKEKKTWVNHFCKDEAILLAVKEGYDCDIEYCLERLAQELPGFSIINETTIFWKLSCPSMIALKMQQRLKTQMNACKSKYGTYIHIFKLEQHNNINYNDVEAIVIFNYIGKFDVIGIIGQLNSELYG